MNVLWSLGISGTINGQGMQVAFVRTDGLRLLTIGPSLFLPYPESLKAKILNIKVELNRLEKSSFSDLGNQRLILLSKMESPLQDIASDVSGWSVQAAKSLIQQSGIHPSLIGFNGQPLFSLKHGNGQQTITYEKGVQKHLSDVFKCPVVYNFGSLDFCQTDSDVSLLPFYYKALFAFSKKMDLMENNNAVAVVDINSISKMTLLDETEKKFAFDVGPGCFLVDEFVQNNFQKSDDNEGSMAQRGVVFGHFITEWLQHDFFQEWPVKFPIESFFQCLDQCSQLLPLDCIATLTAFTAQAIIERAHLYKSITTLILLGAGAKNRFITTLLDRSFKTIQADALGWNCEFIESQQYAFYAAKSLHMRLAKEKEDCKGKGDIKEKNILLKKAEKPSTDF